MKEGLEKSMVGLIAIFGAFISFTMNDISKNIKDLNGNVSTLLERTSNHEKRIDRIENKIKE